MVCTMLRRFRFSFERVPAYGKILEEYRTSEPPRQGALGGRVLNHAPHRLLIFEVVSPYSSAE